MNKLLRKIIAAVITAHIRYFLHGAVRSIAYKGGVHRRWRRGFGGGSLFIQHDGNHFSILVHIGIAICGTPRYLRIPLFVLQIGFQPRAYIRALPLVGQQPRAGAQRLILPPDVARVGKLVVPYQIGGLFQIHPAVQRRHRYPVLGARLHFRYSHINPPKPSEARPAAASDIA